MDKKIKIITVFVPHLGCPNDCIFCDQKKITGKGNTSVTADFVEETITSQFKTIDKDTLVELAFFGGSFTAVDINIQKELLSVAKKYKDLGMIHRIRCSTRPDAINEEILCMLKEYYLDIIELGIQSLDDEVLKKSNRGHTSLDSKNSSRIIKEHGFTLGHQIMPGLPGSSIEKDLQTCNLSIKMQPDIVRIYPTLIIKNTALDHLYKKGLYKPLSMEEAVDISACMYSKYMLSNINVIRIGLLNTDNINTDEDVVAGPCHPAFRQLVEQKLYYTSVLRQLKDKETHGKIIKILANNKIINFISGHNKENIKSLKSELSLNSISFEKSLDENLIEIYENQNKLCSFYNYDIFKDYLALRGDVCF